MTSLRLGDTTHHRTSFKGYILAIHPSSSTTFIMQELLILMYTTRIYTKARQTSQKIGLQLKLPQTSSLPLRLFVSQESVRIASTEHIPI